MLIDMKHFNTYYFCSIAQNLMASSDLGNARLLDDFITPFFEVEPKNFPKISALHSFCYWLVDRYCFEGADEISNELNCFDNIDLIIENSKDIFYRKGFMNDDNYNYSTIELAIKHYYPQKKERLIDWIFENKRQIIFNEIGIDEIAVKYVEYLMDKDIYHDVIRKIVDEMVYILFQNRQFLLSFNEWLANMNPYKVSRINTPVWVKNAVFYRDQGRCVICKKDMSGCVAPLEFRKKHYDHIVPIDLKGLNDISNVQLLCQECNESKGIKIKTDTKYLFYYDIE